MGELSRALSSPLPESLNESMGPCVLKLLVSDRQAGKLIGKHGATVSQIGTTCNVNIRVSASNMFFPTTTDRVVLIGGEISNIETALRNVQERVANPLIDAQSMVMLVHSSLLPNLVGQGCAHLHRAARDFGVSLHVSSRFEGVSERTVKVSHRNSAQAVMSAVLELSTRIMADPATLANLQMNYDAPYRAPTPPVGAELYLSGIVVDVDGTTRAEDGGNVAGASSMPAAGSEEEAAHLAAASLLPFDEIKVDTDQLRGKRTAEAEELICKICHSYFLGCAPKLTKCAHAFCGDCLESWIQVQPTFRSWAQVAKTAGQARLVPCPVCKTPLNDKTDIHLILTDILEPDCVKMAASLTRLELYCHNNPKINTFEEGTCEWQGTYTDYQSHARVCTKNKKKSIVAPNTTAPPQTHHETDSQERDQATVVIPFTAPESIKDTISVEAGNRVAILERSDEGWIYVRNLSLAGEGWMPDYCIKRYDAWFEDMLSAQGKLVEKCAAVRDFDPITDTATKHHLSQFVFLALKEGDVFTVCERSKNDWNLVINSDGSRQGWVPDNRCKVIREGSDHPTTSSSSVQEHSNSIGPVRTFVVRRSFEGDDKSGELSLNQGETVSVRQAHDSGWTLGVVVAGGSKKEGWFPDWVIERSLIDKSNICVNCSASTVSNLTSFVRVSAAQLARPQDLYGPVCTANCWEQWMSKKASAPRPGQARR